MTALNSVDTVFRTADHQGLIWSVGGTRIIHDDILKVTAIPSDSIDLIVTLSAV